MELNDGCEWILSTGDDEVHSPRKIVLVKARYAYDRISRIEHLLVLSDLFKG